MSLPSRDSSVEPTRGSSEPSETGHRAARAVLTLLVRAACRNSAECFGIHPGLADEEVRTAQVYRPGCRLDASDRHAASCEDLLLVTVKARHRRAPPERSGAMGPPRATARGGPGDEVPRSNEEGTHETQHIRPSDRGRGGRRPAGRVGDHGIGADRKPARQGGRLERQAGGPGRSHLRLRRRLQPPAEDPDRQERGVDPSGHADRQMENHRQEIRPGG